MGLRKLDEACSYASSLWPWAAYYKGQEVRAGNGVLKATCSSGSPEAITSAGSKSSARQSMYTTHTMSNTV